LSQKPKLLILYDYYLPAYKAGGPVQSLANLVELLGTDLDIFVLTGTRDLNESGVMEGIIADQWSKTGKASVYYASRISTSLVDRVISEINPAIIYLNGMYSFSFMLYPALKYGNKRKLILAPRGMLAPAALQIKKWKKAPYLYIISRLGLQKKVWFHATKKEETQEVSRVFSADSRIFEIGNVPFQPYDEPEKTRFSPEALHLFSVARLSPEKNVHFIFEVLKNYRHKKNIQLHLIGNPENQDYFRKCLELEKMLPDPVSVDWIGHLDQPVIRKTTGDYHVFISPTLGENFGHSIFEALGAGKPVLISNRTPWHGLEEVQAGFELSLEDPGKWLEKINFFAEMDEITYLAWSRGAWHYARNNYDHTDLKDKYLKMFTFPD